ncbi:MAG: PIN domain-containing protein [Candidatus Bathyarchaeia archaeon]|jgi:predicted nucleic acid-binding protein
MKAVIDTRFLIAHFLAQDELSKKWTQKTLENLQKGANLGIVPSIVIHEFYKFVLETYGKNIADIRVNTILSSRLETANLDPVIGIEAAKLRCRYAELPTADAVIAATAIVMSCEYVLTDDKHIKQVKETKTRWI